MGWGYRDDSEASHCHELLVGGESAVLDAVAQSRVGRQAIQGIQHQLDGIGPLGMRGGLEAGRSRGGKQVLQPAGFVVQVAVGGAATTRQVGGAAGQGPVCVVLDATEGQEVVAQSGVEAQAAEGIHVAGEHVHGDAQPEATGIAGGQEGPHLAFGHLAVADRGDPCGEELLLGCVEHQGQVVGMVRKVEVRSVVADLHPVPAGEEVAGGVEDPTVGPSVGVVADEAADGGRGVGRDPRFGEGRGS